MSPGIFVDAPVLRIHIPRPLHADHITDIDMDHIRNIAIIAHVDFTGNHLWSISFLKQAGTFRANEAKATEIRIMDSMDLEREKGITIRAKNAAFKWHEYHVNIVDTPGHADFGGEVERIMKMIDGVLLVVDAHDGPQAQTKFVLRKALENGAKPIVVINKIDRDNARPHKVLDFIFDLFVELNATDIQLDFPVIYASARDGYAMREIHEKSETMEPLFEAIVKHIPPPPKSDVSYFQMLISNLDYSDYLGRIAYGRITSGRVKVGDSVVRINKDGRRERAAVTALFGHVGLAKVELKNASAGDIIGLCGFEDAYIGETITDTEERVPLHFVDIDPPTISMKICINDGPLAGREGKLLTARQVRERLVRETRTNVSIEVADTDVAGHFDIKARGEMQIAILVEQMRREGFEILVSRPEVIFQRDDAVASCSNLTRAFMSMCPTKTWATSCNRWPGARPTFSAWITRRPPSRCSPPSRRAASSVSRPISSTPPRAMASCRISSRNTPRTRATSPPATTAFSWPWRTASRPLTPSTRSRSAAGCSSGRRRKSTRAWSSAKTPGPTICR